MKILYKGYGKLSNIAMHEQYGMILPETLCRKVFYDFLVDEDQSNKMLKRAHLGNLAVSDPILNLYSEHFNLFMEARRNHWNCDHSIRVNGRYIIPVNRFLLSIHSTYFSFLFSSNYSQAN